MYFSIRNSIGSGSFFFQICRFFWDVTLLGKPSKIHSPVLWYNFKMLGCRDQTGVLKAEVPHRLLSKRNLPIWQDSSGWWICHPFLAVGAVKDRFHQCLLPFASILPYWFATQVMTSGMMSIFSIFRNRRDSMSLLFKIWAASIVAP